MNQGKQGRTKKEILKAAQIIIQNEGYEKITVRHLAEVTGYSHTIFYHYFKNLHGLLWTLRLEMIDGMIDELGKAPLESGDSVDDIVFVFTEYANYFMTNPNIFRFFYFYPFSDPNESMLSSEIENRFQSMWQESFACLISEGVISQDQLFVVAKSIIYAISGLLLLNLSTAGLATRIDIEREIEGIIKFLLRNNNNHQESNHAT
jgi:AcrR family transcriptional regulator